MIEGLRKSRKICFCFPYQFSDFLVYNLSTNRINKNQLKVFPKRVGQTEEEIQKMNKGKKDGKDFPQDEKRDFLPCLRASKHQKQILEKRF